MLRRLWILQSQEPCLVVLLANGLAWGLVILLVTKVVRRGSID